MAFKMMRQGLVLVMASLLALAAQADSRQEIDAGVREALQKFYRHSSAGKELADKSVGMLVFPNVVKAGVAIGGEYGEGSLLVEGRTAAYYSIASASLGLQLGVQSRSMVILFMNDKALEKFRASEGWKAGVDGSVAFADMGTGGAVDTETAKKPIIGFIFSNKGMMANLTFEGSKISRIDR